MTTPTPSVDIATIFPALQGQRREAIRLHPRRGADPGLAVSKMGGLFLWPSEEPWPQCTVEEPLDEWLEDPPGSGRYIEDNTPIAPGHPRHNDYLVGVLQLRREDVPQMPFPGDTDLFQLLWCPRYHGTDALIPFCRATWRRAAMVQHPRTQAPTPRRSDPDGDLIPHPCVLSPEPVSEYPSSHDLPARVHKEIARWEKTPQAHGYSYFFDLSVAQGTKIGGYFTSLASPPAVPVCASCQRPMEYLLTVASGEWGTRAGRERWCPEEERHLLWDVPFVNDAEREAAIEPCVHISRGYHLNFFICRQHPEWLIGCAY